MAYKLLFKSKRLIFIPLLLILMGIAVACGEDATPAPVVVEKEVIKEVPVEVIKEVPVEVIKEVPVEVIKEVPVEVEKEVIKEVIVEKEVVREIKVTVIPTAAPTPTPQPAGTFEPEGTVNIGFKGIGIYDTFPTRSSQPSAQFISITAHESLSAYDGNGQFEPMLAESWSVSPDNLVWTFNLRKGIQFHKGYGEMTAADVVWSMEKAVAEGSTHISKSGFQRIFFSPGGSISIPDPHTLVVNTGFPQWDVMLWLSLPLGAGGVINSKNQYLDTGEDFKPGVGTGPYQYADSRTGEFWRFEVVRDHWRVTPEFEEMVLWEIPEESTRVANFQAGRLDTMNMAIDSIPALSKIAGTKFMVQPGAVQARVGIYGQYYVGLGTEDQRSGYDPDLPWISPNADVNSPEWERARKVRLALSKAIDRDLIIDTLFQGEGAPAVIWGWMGFEDWLEPDMFWDYDPEGAKALLAEAGYPDGISLTLTPAIRGAVNEVEACEVVASMWTDIGINVNFEKLPWATTVQEHLARSGARFTCHSNPPYQQTPYHHTPRTLPTDAVYNQGVEHDFFDFIVSAIGAEMDPVKRKAMILDMGRFMFDNVLEIGLYNVQRQHGVAHQFQDRRVDGASAARGHEDAKRP